MSDQNSLVMAADRLLKHPDDVMDKRTREFSFGSSGQADNFLSEGRGADEVSFTITNDTTVNCNIAVIPPASYGTIFPDNATFLSKIGADAALDDGTIFTDGGKNVTVVRNDSGHTLNEFIRSIGNSTRILSVSYESRVKSTGNVDSTNYNTALKTYFVSPYRTPKEESLNLRQFQSNRANSPQFADVNFKQAGFTVLLSPEHAFVQTVKPDTILSVTFKIGFVDSRPQRAYRAVRKADEQYMMLQKQM